MCSLWKSNGNWIIFTIILGNINCFSHYDMLQCSIPFSSCQSGTGTDGTVHSYGILRRYKRVEYLTSTALSARSVVLKPYSSENWTAKPFSSSTNMFVHRLIIQSLSSIQTWSFIALRKRKNSVITPEQSDCTVNAYVARTVTTRTWLYCDKMFTVKIRLLSASVLSVRNMPIGSRIIVRLLEDSNDRVGQKST